MSHSSAPPPVPEHPVPGAPWSGILRLEGDTWHGECRLGGQTFALVAAVRVDADGLPCLALSFGMPEPGPPPPPKPRGPRRW
jgi:hypothetical protein